MTNTMKRIGILELEVLSFMRGSVPPLTLKLGRERETK